MEFITVKDRGIVALSAYQRIVEELASEYADSPRKILYLMHNPHDSDMRSFFIEDCEYAQIPLDTEQLPEILKALWDLYA